MVSNQILRSTLDEITRITETEAVLYDNTGKIIAESRLEFAPDEEAESFAKSKENEVRAGDAYFTRIYGDQETVYILAVRSSSPNAVMAQKLIDFQVKELCVAYREKFDKDSFIKNLLLDNLLPVDVYNRARKLQIEFNALRAVFIVKTKAREAQAREATRSVLSSRGSNFVTTVDENTIVITHEVVRNEDPDGDLADFAARLSEALKASDIEAIIAYGTAFSELKNVSRSYKEAGMAIDVGSVFYENRHIIPYNDLGIGRLIYQLPLNLCRMFIREIFGTLSPDELDEETLNTVDKFFENNLNVSETSRQLFIHRNTLVYRLDKLQRTIGLDLRTFDDAITFKIALMVVKYMEYMEKIEY